MEEFENALIQLFNQTLLPFDAKRYVVLKFARDVEVTYQAAKKRQQAEQEAAKTEESEVKANE